MWLVSLPSGCVLLALLTAALFTVVNGSERLWSLNEKLFVEDGRLWWLAAWFVLKCVHEMGHAIAGGVSRPAVVFGPRACTLSF